MTGARRPTLVGLDPAGVPRYMRATFHARISGDPTGAPEWVHDIAGVGEGAGWFEPDGVVWRVHGDVATLVGGVAALLGQAAHPLALAGVQRHSAYREDPWKRLAGTARWVAGSTFGSAEFAEREAARVRRMHAPVQGVADCGRAYAAHDPDLLRWVHLVLTDAFVGAHKAVGVDLTRRFGRRWPDVYVSEWRRSAEALGATDLPATEAELYEALAAYSALLMPVPHHVRAFLAAPPGLSPPEQLFHRALAGAAGYVLSPVMAPVAGVPGRGGGGRAQLAFTNVQLRGLRALVGPYIPPEEAARWRLGLGPRPAWADVRPAVATRTVPGPAVAHRPIAVAAQPGANPASYEGPSRNTA